MDTVPIHLAHCGDGPARAVPDEEGRCRFRCAGCGREFVVVEEDGAFAASPDEAEGLVQVEPVDPFAGVSPAERLRALLHLAYGTADRLRAIEVLSTSWYLDMYEGEEDAAHRVTDLFVAGDHVYVTLEIGEGACRWDGRGVLISEPTLVFVWTLAWGPGTRFVGEVEARLVERFESVAPPTDDLGEFRPVLAWWSPGLWRVGFVAAITPAIDKALVQAVVPMTRRFARRIASLAIDPATVPPLIREG